MRVKVRSARRLGAAELATGAAGLITIGEPSVAIAGDRILLAGNCYTARSLDRGVRWEALDPYTYLDPPPLTPFCCDQTVYYDAAHDLMFWLLQYETSATDNTLRLAIKRGATLGDDDWQWWDFTPTAIDPAWTDEWFDYNHAAATADHFFLGTNMYPIGEDRMRRSIVLRFRFATIISAIDSGTELDFDVLEEEETGLRCAGGTMDTMYIAGPVSFEKIRVYSWPDADVNATSIDVTVSPWTNSSYSAPGPDGNDWLSRCDDRMMTGAVMNDRVVWMWTANRFGEKRPYPYIRVAIVDPVSGAVIGEPDIWSPDFAYAYPDAATTAEGVVGVTMFRGGNATHPSHVVGAYDDASGAWTLTTAVHGANGPGDGLWGDYLTCRATNDAWLAVGFTLQGGTTLANVVVDLVEFTVVMP
jgi:hypothetical protein